MSAVACRVERGLDVTTLFLTGELGAGTTPTVRAAILKCLADSPAALVIEVAGLTAHSDVPLTVFPAAAWHAAQWPVVPVVLCAPSRALAARLRRTVGRQIPVYATRQEALAALAVPPGGDRRVVLDLAATADAPAEARRLVTEVCHRWGLAHVVGDAQLIASELVSNAVRHADPPVRLVVAVRDDLLLVVVRDGSRRLPLLPDAEGGSGGALADGGRGLRLVASFATSWGGVPTAGGKAVWATVRVRPLALRAQPAFS